jgi:hypothetical protein
MTAVGAHPLLSALLRQLPVRLRAALDGWSQQVARQRAQRRRESTLRRQAAARQP